MKRSDALYAVLRRPLFVIALALWAVNDHVIKYAYPGLLSGKLSDVASLVVAPLLLALVARRVFSRGSDLALVSLSAVVLGLAMATINTWDPAADAYRWGLGLLQWPFRAGWHWTVSNTVCLLHPVSLTMDLTDLYTIPAAAVSPIAVCGNGLSRGADEATEKI